MIFGACFLDFERQNLDLGQFFQFSPHRSAVPPTKQPGGTRLELSGTAVTVGSRSPRFWKFFVFFGACFLDFERQNLELDLFFQFSPHRSAVPPTKQGVPAGLGWSGSALTVGFLTLQFSRFSLNLPHQ